jgi:hypothetical protein
MKRIPKPSYRSRRVFSTCISKVADSRLRQALTAFTGEVVTDSTSFAAAARTNTLHRLVPRTLGVGTPTKKELVSVYTYRMAKAGAPGRSIYEEIRSLAPLDICPLCDHGVVSTLDHHLPKANYPVLAVTPLNLIPACSDCNKSKTSRRSKTRASQTLNPYYDSLETFRWLLATFPQTTPVVMKFSVVPGPGWSSEKEERYKTHLSVFRLNKLFATQASRELQDRKGVFQEIHGSDGPAGVRDFLEREVRSCEREALNSWRSATYRALARSNWFCNGGFG